MKNDNNTNRINRNESHYKAPQTDLLVNQEVIQNNQIRIGQQPRRRRRRNYEKKIMNDPFLFNV